ncbi:myb/SANT-like DNA-binding domain-containing protein 4 [Pyrus ussuriensis x Pyrus communis]|uniref:Myb/SANT-like DNA-binding domain-containing protein 4 n=1 Tax=Pyrus ussuriensis x Pyrus communis TaxID=2448454 RepID=A0A5N5FSR5_9ROSA|nr:myb/SANT-like DNA-binding domain-containing protein 4 [Pyrus ussuriensis x Pyrus communis]
MDSSGLGGGFMSGPSGGILDLESPVPRRQEMQLGHQLLGHHQHHMNVMGGGGIAGDRHPIGLVEVKGSVPKVGSSIAKGKAVASFNGNNGYNLSDDDEQNYTDDESIEGAKGKKGSRWQRMKWTDNVVRLLIDVVACVGDDGSDEGGEGLKRKSGILQKKGKWKTVSQIMISKGCHVSPQQCEDKFNDLNKRYKRLNDILGRGTSCRVVENPALMDAMPHLSAKAKDDVRKILSSKHLFYKEMCAHHNGQRIPDCQELNPHGHSLPLGRCSKDINGSEEEEAEENHDSEDDKLDNEDHNNADNDRERMRRMSERKKAREEDGHMWPQHVPLDSFEVEVGDCFQDATKSLWERRDWIKKQKLQLEEQRVSFHAEALEIEKQRYKWLRYCSKKDRELERLRLENERMKLENERRVLQLRQKEVELDLRRSEASLEPSSLGLGRDHIDLGRH